jgi:hypothetical protein
MSWGRERLVIPGTPEFILIIKPDTVYVQNLESIQRCSGITSRYFALRTCEFGTYKFI